MLHISWGAGSLSSSSSPTTGGRVWGADRESDSCGEEEGREDGDGDDEEAVVEEEEEE